MLDRTGLNGCGGRIAAMSDRGTALARVRELETANTKLEEQVARLTAALDSSRADAPHELVESAAGGPVAVRDVTGVEG
jgi:hypothetical protein